MSYVSLSNIIQTENDKEHRATVNYVDNSVLNTFSILNAANLLGDSFKFNNGKIDVEAESILTFNVIGYTKTNQGFASQSWEDGRLDIYFDSSNISDSNIYNYKFISIFPNLQWGINQSNNRYTIMSATRMYSRYFPCFGSCYYNYGFCMYIDAQNGGEYVYLIPLLNYTQTSGISAGGGSPIKVSIDRFGTTNSIISLYSSFINPTNNDLNPQFPNINNALTVIAIS